MRITCEQTFFKGNSAACCWVSSPPNHGEDPDAVDFDPEVKVAGVPAPEGFFAL